ncbi:MAG: family 10 glycosylhydrolase [Bacillota bacterium]
MKRDFRRRSLRPGAARFGGLLLVGLMLSPPLLAGSPAQRAYELRGIWLDNGYVARLDARAGVARLMDQLKDAGFNAVFVETLYRGYTLYAGPYQDMRFEGWPEDPLQVVVEEAHRRELRVHAWMWMLGAGVHGEAGPVLAAHPGWADRSVRGRAFSGAGGGVLWLDPSRAEVREFLAEQAAYVARRYAVDGIHLDYIRYSDELSDPFGYAPHAQEAFRAATGIDVAGRAPEELPSAERAAWRSWREAQVTAVVRQVRDSVERTAPAAVISAAVLPEPAQARIVHLQNWIEWLANGLIDIAIPMAYTSSLPNLADILHSIDAELERLSPYRKPEAMRSRVAPGLALFATRPEGLAQQAAHVREAGFGGVVAFSASYLSLPARGVLASAFSAPAAHPPALRAEMASLPPLPPQPLPEGPAAPAVAGAAPAGPNKARQATVTVDSTFRGYSAAPLNDGQLNDVLELGRWAQVAWASAERPGDHFVELRWAQPQSISQVDVYWALDRGRFFSSSRLRIEVEKADGGGWETLWEYTSQPTHRISRTSVTFVPVTARALRLVQPAGGGPLGRPDLMWIAEVEVYGEGWSGPGGEAR